MTRVLVLVYCEDGSFYTVISVGTDLVQYLPYLNITYMFFRVMRPYSTRGLSISMLLG